MPCSALSLDRIGGVLARVMTRRQVEACRHGREKKIGRATRQLQRLQHFERGRGRGRDEGEVGFLFNLTLSGD